MQLPDKPETYQEQLEKFRANQVRREETLRVAPSSIDNGQIFAQCPRCQSAKDPDGEPLCGPCLESRAEKWAANAKEGAK